MEITDVQDIAYHRNGISGEGFYVVLFEADVDGEDRSFMATVFADDELIRASPRPDHNPRVAVIELEDMHVQQRGGNPESKFTGAYVQHRAGWRGDLFAGQLYDAILEDMNTEHGSMMFPTL